MLELIKLLEFFKIKDRLFSIIIDSASNNKTIKDELDKALNR